MAANETSVIEETLEGCALMEDKKNKTTPPEKEVFLLYCVIRPPLYNSQLLGTQQLFHRYCPV